MSQLLPTALGTHWDAFYSMLLRNPDAIGKISSPSGAVDRARKDFRFAGGLESSVLAALEVDDILGGIRVQLLADVRDLEQIVGGGFPVPDAADDHRQLSVFERMQHRAKGFDVHGESIIIQEQLASPNAVLGSD